MTTTEAIEPGAICRITYYVRGWVKVEYSATAPVILRIRREGEPAETILETGRMSVCRGVGFLATEYVRMGILVDLENPHGAERAATVKIVVIGER